MTIFIEGLAFPLGELNANGWGIPFAEAENAIKSLKTSVVRICSRVDPHGCDYVGDPNSEIGHVVDAWQDGDNIIAKAEITDSIAAQKIEDGTWKQTWSVFAGFSDVDSGGWAHGIAVESITIVNDPAWESAQWKVISASAGEIKRLRKISQFKIIASKTGDGTIPDEPTIEDLKKQIADKDKLIEELKPKAESVTALETQVAELSASKTDLEKKLAISVPAATLEEKIAAAIEKHDIEMEAKRTLAAAREKFVAARKELGIETKPEEFTSLSASDFEAMTEALSVKLSASWNHPPRYKADDSGAARKSPIYDPVTRTYKEE